ncbi:acyltransferase family protein [Gilvimarinus sp. DA14]|uniref:acyltransferase family protein n=1 Tax=Gilvimarinus sp. DA14 TaxID=2956798 RepID=UPI0020B7000D|nr:acyltransferase family protein [Gilvimarinus sp. DA14]UTF59008.1 acyltransferase [Gilvimarinus sp. DA14]
MSIPPAWHQQRRHELDWLRVLAFTLLIAYHIGMAYVADWGWHIKSQHQSETLQYAMLWSNQWRMSLLFLISGAAVSYQLQKHSGIRVIGTNSRRLLLPLLFGTLVIVAPQAYVESKVEGAIGDMSYLTFWRNYLGYPLGFSDPLPPVYLRLEPTQVIYNHLWYLLYLFAYIAVLWLLYPLLDSKRARCWGQWLGERTPQWVIIIAPALVLFSIGELLWKRFPTTFLLLDDWFNNARYFFAFFLGFLLVRSNSCWGSFAHYRWLTLILALSAYLAIAAYSRGANPFPAPLEFLGESLKGFIWSANGWLWIATILGWAQAWLSKPNLKMSEVNRAIFCFYILHQTVIIVLLYWLMRFELNMALEVTALTVLTVVVCILSYLLVRRIPGFRVLLGVNR